MELTKPVIEYESVRESFSGLSPGTQKYYKIYLTKFCEFVHKTPDKILAERREQVRSTDERMKHYYERKALEFYEHEKSRLGEQTAFYTCLGAVRAFFSRNYYPLQFGRRGPRAPIQEFRDYVPTIEEVREIVHYATVRDKAAFLLMLQTGLAPIDICGLKRGMFERAIQKGSYPVWVGDISREKTRTRARVFIGRDSGEAIGRYLRMRRDKSPYLFVELRHRGRKAERVDARFIDGAFQLAVRKSGIKPPEGQRLRAYSLRKLFETQGTKVMPGPWIDLLMGHRIPGARSSYIVPNHDELLEAYRRLEPLISISGLVPREEKIEELVNKRIDERLREYDQRREALNSLVSKLRENPTWKELEEGILEELITEALKKIREGGRGDDHTRKKILFTAKRDF